MLAASNLSYERFFEPVFRPLSFSLDAGQLIVVRGPNGCGKTTLIRVLAGILQPTTGRLERGAEPPALVGHQAGLKEDLSVLENTRFTDRLRGGRKSDSDLRAVLERLDIADCSEQTVRSLSAGQKKRTALARLLLLGAGLWLLDEPYSNLDTSGISILDALLAEHLQAGGACVLATHGSHQPPASQATELLMEAGGGLGG